MTANGLSGLLYHNVIKSTGNSAVYNPGCCIKTNPLTDNYTIGDNIGRGKFAVVKKCVSKETGEEVAAKFIKKRRRGKSCREDILREVVMLEMVLDHPRLVNLKEVYETPTELIIITEYCEGGELFTECILEEKFNESDVRLLISQILEGLVYLHDKNIVHLDLKVVSAYWPKSDDSKKPQNILLTTEFPQGSVKICDLGFACLVNIGEDIRDIIGTPDYVAPEVLNYDPLGLYTDMWSLGVLTYVMLTTCSPFAGDDKQQTFCNITTVNLDFPPELFEEISGTAQDFIKKLLIAEPSDRMTATECMQHEWITGAYSPSTCIPPAGIETSQADPDYRLGETSTSDLHVKVKNEISSMSVTEDPEGSQSRTSMDLSQSDTRPDFLMFCNTNVDPKKGDSEDYQFKKTLQAVLREEQTPDSESSMCLSDNKLDDDDSGVGTGTETRAGSENRTLSRRSSTDVITDKECESDEEINLYQEHVDEATGDQNMISKRSLENQVNNTRNSYENLSEHMKTLNKNTLRVQGDLNTNNSVTTELEVENAEMEHSDITESSVTDNQHSFTKGEMEGIPMSNQSSFSVYSTDNRIPDIQPMDQTSPVSFRKHVGFRDRNINYTVAAQRTSPSISGESGAIQPTVCSGEKHKRVMCNPSSIHGDDQSENADQEEYEFVSVSKRVKSYEQALTPSPKKEQFSPKITRSPRIGRHVKSHHHHH